MINGELMHVQAGNQGERIHH